jgi:hypothetical protein
VSAQSGLFEEVCAAFFLKLYGVQALHHRVVHHRM